MFRPALFAVAVPALLSWSHEARSPERNAFDGMFYELAAVRQTDARVQIRCEEMLSPIAASATVRPYVAELERIGGSIRMVAANHKHYVYANVPSSVLTHFGSSFRRFDYVVVGFEVDGPGGDARIERTFCVLFDPHHF